MRPRCQYSASAATSNDLGLCLFQHRRPTGDDNGSYDDRINPLRDEVPHRRELSLDASLCIIELEIDASGLGHRFHIGGERDAPVAFCTDLREAHGLGRGRRRSEERGGYKTDKANHVRQVLVVGLPVGPVLACHTVPVTLLGKNSHLLTAAL